MSYQNRASMWYFVKSLLIMAVVLLPFFYVGQILLSGRFVSPWTLNIVDTIFAPAAWIFNMICTSMQYCVASQYPGAAVMVPIYILSTIMYGYFISLIWRWVSVSPIRRRRYVEYDEHDGSF